MTDIHCHILPFFDDGAADIAQALSMARLAADSGVSRIAATPHFTGIYSRAEDAAEILDRFEELKAEIAKAEIPVELFSGAEILCTEQTPLMASEGLLPSINGSKYLLTEFDFDSSADFISRILSEIRDEGYLPIIAHPERYEAVQRHPSIAEYWFGEGYILQLNKGSLLGAFGGRPQLTSRSLLENGLAHVIASDAHSDHTRTTDFSALTDWLYSNCDSEYADILLKRNPRRIIEGREVVPAE